MKTYKLIGLTGTTGSGKSSVTEIFKSNGYTVIDADFLAREIMNNVIVLHSLQEFFGNDVVENNQLNRPLLAQRAFKDKRSVLLLNQITHPFIAKLFTDKLKYLVQNNEQKILFDAPQLFESNLDVYCDEIVGVIAYKETRINRIMARDNITREKAEGRINIQLSEEFFKANCHYIIENNRDLTSLKSETEKIINKL